jgi:acyl-coenzyme A thioesterase PaaI-like protein
VFENEPLKIRDYTSCQRSHCNCIVCGEQNPIGLGLAFRIGDDGTVYSEFEASDLLQGYSGILHGGIVAALLDACMTHCLFHHGVEAVTGALEVRFMKPVPCDASLTIRATLTTSHPPLYKLKSTLESGGRLMAHGHAKFVEADVNR